MQDIKNNLINCTLNEAKNNTDGQQSSFPPYRAFDMQTYMHNMMKQEIKEFQECTKTKTGFRNLDAETSLYPGLYVLGAISSLGKTTFVHQMADQIAAAGGHVIYFSLEQTVLELASKSVSRAMAKLIVILL